MAAAPYMSNSLDAWQQFAARAGTRIKGGLMRSSSMASPTAPTAPRVGPAEPGSLDPAAVQRRLTAPRINKGF